MKKLVISFLTLVLILLPLQRVFCGVLDDLNQQIKAKQEVMKQLEDSIDVYKKSIEQKQNERITIGNQVSILDSQIVKTGLDIQMAKAQIDYLNLEIESLNLEIKDREAKIAKQKNILANLLNLINISDSKNYLRIILSTGSFSDYFNQVKYLESLNSDINRYLGQTKQDKADLEAKERIAQAKKDKVVEVKKTLEDRQASLDDKKESKQYLLAQTRMSESKFTLLLAQLRQEYSSFDQEVANLQRRIEKELADANKIQTGVETAISWPTGSHVVNAYFHDPTYPFRFLYEHPGIDVKISQGTPVYAAAAGYVGWTRNYGSRSYGNCIMIIHNGGLATLYGHLSRFNVGEDVFVKRGDLIGYSGGTPGTFGAGFSTGPHLHFEVRDNGIPVDPLAYLTR